MADLAEQYLSCLQALLPPGAAWPREPSAVLTKLLAAEADALARVHDRSAALIDEGDPRLARELLADWERVCALPDPCSAGIATTVEERRDAVVARLTSRGRQSVQYFADIIAALSYAATIDEWRPFIAGTSCCGDPLNGGHDIRHVWQVTVHGPRLTLFRTGVSEIGDLLGKLTGGEDLACILQRLKPAHTYLILTFDEV